MKREYDNDEIDNTLFDLLIIIDEAYQCHPNAAKKAAAKILRVAYKRGNVDGLKECVNSMKGK